VNILIVDDHPVICNALMAQLGVVNRYLVAVSLRQGLELVAQHPEIDLIIYDLNLPDSCGMEGFLRLRTAACSIPVLVFSACSDKREIEQALKLGACGFVPKSTAVEEFAHAIDVVLKGKTYIPEAIFGWPHPALPAMAGRGNFLPQLTAAEREILPLVVDGLSNKAIARLLDRSEHTVRVHLQHILKKAGADNRTQLAARWFGARQS
jgi:DNA-binding NarL/FixJ family response regulator